MTDILFINSSDENRLRSQVNGTMLLATKLLAANFKVDILRFYEIDSYNKGDYYKFIDDIVAKTLAKNPKCVSFYSLWPYYHILLRIAKRIREFNPNIVIVMAGPHSSLTAQATMEAMEFVDYIPTGEGENTVVPFFTSVLRENLEGIENIPGLYYRKNGKIEFNHTAVELCDLNTLPHWDDRLYTVTETGLDNENYYMPIDAGRGCPYSCTFCCTSFFWKRNYRLKSPERIVEDIKYYNQKFGIKSFLFSHDAFTVNKKLVIGICDYIIENKLDIKWKCTARINCITEDLILKMKESGLTAIEFGIETGSPRMQKIINKNLNLEKVKETVSFIVKNKIDVSLFFVYGFPDETEEDLNQTLNLVFDFIAMGIKHVSFSYCRFNPATEITKKYFDDLVFEPEIKILSRAVFGYPEELQMIKDNKGLFSQFYHLNTPVRNNYQYLIYFVYLYRTFPNSLKLIRGHYADNLEFYKSFYNNNIDLFNENVSVINDVIFKNPVQVLSNTFKDFAKPLRDRICALLEYDFDLQTVIKSKEDMLIQKKYAFNYLEYQLKLPLEQYSDSSTELLIEKKNGKVNIRVISI